MDFIGLEEDEGLQLKNNSRRKKGGRKQINKKTKFNLKFDQDARKEFLLGFRKRKQERKEKYHEKLQKRLAKEKIKAREEAKKSIAKKQKKSSSHNILPEVKHIIDEEEDDEDNDGRGDEEVHTVGSTIIRVANLEPSLNPRQSSFKTETDEDDFNGLLKYKHDSFADSNKDLYKLEKIKEALKRHKEVAEDITTNTLIKKKTNKLLQESDIFKRSLKLKQRRSKKFKQYRFLSQDSEDTAKSKSKHTKSQRNVKSHNLKSSKNKK